jgi:hypothetical protein
MNTYGISPVRSMVSNAPLSMLKNSHPNHPRGKLFKSDGTLGKL